MKLINIKEIIIKKQKESIVGIQLSYSALSIFRDCKLCFYNDRIKKLSRPRGIFSSLPNGIDGLLKKKLEVYRGSLPPVLNVPELQGFQLYAGTDLAKMRNWKTNPLKMQDTKGNIIVGAFDDLLFNPNTQEYAFLDYKTKGTEPDQAYCEMSKEIWKPIFDGLYAVSDLGIVKRLISFKNSKKDRILKQTETIGAPIVGLIKDGKKITRSVSRLIAEAFLGPKNKKTIIKYRNGNPENCSLKNIFYYTHEETLKRRRCYSRIWDKKNRTIRNAYHSKRRKEVPWIHLLTDIKTRCNNPNNERFKNYGGRGIKCLITSTEIKSLWFRDKAYELKKPSIDRINNDGHYEVSNCQFIEQRENTLKMWRERRDRTGKIAL